MDLLFVLHLAGFYYGLVYPVLFIQKEHIPVGDHRLAQDLTQLHDLLIDILQVLVAFYIAVPALYVKPVVLDGLDLKVIIV